METIQPQIPRGKSNVIEIPETFLKLCQHFPRWSSFREIPQNALSFAEAEIQTVCFGQMESAL